MPCYPGRPLALLEDIRVSVLAKDVVATNINEAIALFGESVERRLVLVRGHAIASYPSRPLALLKDSVLMILVGNGISVDMDKAIALFRELVEFLLILRSRKSMSSYPCRP